MKFTKAISREVEISGATVVVTLDEAGASFRIKGKRRSTHAAWPDLLGVSVGEGGEPALNYLGLSIEQPSVEPPAELEPEAQSDRTAVAAISGSGGSTGEGNQ